MYCVSFLLHLAHAAWFFSIQELVLGLQRNSPLTCCTEITRFESHARRQQGTPTNHFNKWHLFGWGESRKTTEALCPGWLKTAARPPQGTGSLAARSLGNFPEKWSIIGSTGTGVADKLRPYFKVKRRRFWRGRSPFVSISSVCLRDQLCGLIVSSVKCDL